MSFFQLKFQGRKQSAGLSSSVDKLLFSPTACKILENLFVHFPNDVFCWMHSFKHLLLILSLLSYIENVYYEKLLHVRPCLLSLSFWVFVAYTLLSSAFQYADMALCRVNLAVFYACISALYFYLSAICYNWTQDTDKQPILPYIPEVRSTKGKLLKPVKNLWMYLKEKRCPRSAIDWVASLHLDGALRGRSWLVFALAVLLTCDSTP